MKRARPRSIFFFPKLCALGTMCAAGFRSERCAVPARFRISSSCSQRRAPKARVVFVAYTTTNIGYSGQRRPRQYILVDEEHARALGQSKPFVIDVMRVAKLPATLEFFPDLRNERASNFGHDPAVLQRVVARANELSREGWRVDVVNLTESPSPKVGR